MRDKERVQLEPCFVLHQRPYRNSSQLVECLSAHFGRIALVARGSRGLRRGGASLLQPFVPLRMTWVQRGELGRLVDAEPASRAIELHSERLFAAFYLNELLLRLTARGDANAALFSCYSRCLAELEGAENLVPRAVRLFELRLLEALGYGVQLERDALAGDPIEAGLSYLFEPERGLVPTTRADDADTVYRGEHLISLRDERLADAPSLASAKRLLAAALAVHLGGRQLNSRAVLKDVFARGLGA
jgi:DNA repair protein RecO (recombination protein O)